MLLSGRQGLGAEHPAGTGPFRAAVVGRARFIEDLVVEQAEMLALAIEAGFKDAEHVSGTLLAERYFADRTDGLRPSSGEDLLVATT